MTERSLNYYSNISRNLFAKGIFKDFKYMLVMLRIQRLMYPKERCKLR